MKKEIVIVVFFILACSLFSYAQDTPAWINSIENAIKQQESKCKIENRNWYSEGGTSSFGLTLNCNEEQETVKINKVKDSPNIKETFEGQVNYFDNSMGWKKKKVKLDKFGDEAYLWIPANRYYWTVLKFIKKDIFVEIFSNSELRAKKFAKLIIERLPED